MAKFYGASTEDENYSSIDVGENILGGDNTIQMLMNVEAALAKAQGKLGVIPQEYADEIVRKCDIKFIDEKVYSERRRITGHPLMGMLGAYKSACDGKAGEYIHWGATTQDISDTALMLQLKEVHKLVLSKTIKVREMLIKLATENKSLVIMGRTNDQHALPITLGFKIATWIDELDRAIERLQESEKRVFVGQFAGAVGTMASLGEKGLEIQKLMFEDLGLITPRISWFATRDRLTEFTMNLALLCGALGRMGNEVYNAQRTEVNELAEGFKAGQVGSSTMPHKRNPFAPARLASRGRSAKSILVDSMQCLENTNERDCRTLVAEPYYIKEICCLTDGALDVALDLFESLEIHNKNINENINCLNGLVFTEAIMMHLGKEIGRMEAHDIVHELAMESIDKGYNLKDLVLKHEVTSKHITAKELDKIMCPKKYIGLSEYFVEQIVNR